MRFLVCYLVLSTCCVLKATAQAQPTLYDLLATPVRINGVDCALFPAVASFDTLGYHVARAMPYRLTPTRQQVEVVETLLAEKGLVAIAKPAFPVDSMLIFIRSNEALSYIHTHLLGYKRQYFGFYNSQHQRCLSVQFIEAPDNAWLYKRLMIMDGGTGVWEFCYNLDTNLFYFFGIHGLG